MSGIKIFESSLGAMRFLRSNLNVLEESRMNKIYFAFDEYSEKFIVSYGSSAGSHLGEFIEKEFYKDPEDAEYHASNYKVHEYFISIDAEEYPFTFRNSKPSRLISHKKYSRISRQIGTEYSVGFHIAS